jgi:hypothetical protein
MLKQMETLAQYNAATILINQEKIELAEAYVHVANVYIRQAARKGDCCATVYCPYPVSKEFCSILQSEGYLVEKSHYRPGFYNIVWDEKKYRDTYNVPTNNNTRLK